MGTSQAVVERMAELTRSQIDLVIGLRAAAAESADWRAARALNLIAAGIERGQEPEDLLATPATGLNGYVRRLVACGLESDTLGLVLSEYIAHQARLRRLRDDVRRCFSYPIMLVMMLAAVMALLGRFVMPELVNSRLFDDLDIATVSGSGIVVAMIWWAESGMRSLLLAFLLVVAGGWLLSWIAGRGRFRWFLTTAPFVGRIMQWTGTIEFANLVRLLVARSVPLEEALQVASRALRDANQSDVSAYLALGLRAGMAPGELMAASSRVTGVAAMLWQWGETENRLPEALALTGRYYEGRLEQRVAWLNAVLPPVVFFLVAGMAAAIALAIYQTLGTVGNLILNFI